MSAFAGLFLTSCDKEGLFEPTECVEPHEWTTPDCVKEHTSHLEGKWILTNIEDPTGTIEMINSADEMLEFDLDEMVYTSSYVGGASFNQKFSIETRESFVTKENEDFIVDQWDIPDYTIGIDSISLAEPIEGPSIVICYGPYSPGYFEIKCDRLYIHSDSEAGITKVYERYEYTTCDVK